MQARELVLRPQILRHQLKVDSDLGLLILITPVSLEREQRRAESLDMRIGIILEHTYGRTEGWLCHEKQPLSFYLERTSTWV